MEKSIHSARYAAFLALLRETRLTAGLTQIELANRLNETQTFISKCERGERRIDVVELESFCRALGTSLPKFAAGLQKVMQSKPAKRTRRKPA